MPANAEQSASDQAVGAAVIVALVLAQRGRISDWKRRVFVAALGFAVKGLRHYGNNMPNPDRFIAMRQSEVEEPLIACRPLLSMR